MRPEFDRVLQCQSMINSWFSSSHPSTMQWVNISEYETNFWQVIQFMFPQKVTDTSYLLQEPIFLTLSRAKMYPKKSASIPLIG